MSVSEPERVAFRLWMRSGEKTGRERAALRKEAILTLENAISGGGRGAGAHPSLIPTLRKWKGVVACEEGKWIAARFEFLQGRGAAELHDPQNVPWFDAAVTETEVWSALTPAGLRPDALAELVTKLDRASTLYASMGDRWNAQFTADWAQWFKVFVDPAVPAPDLAGRILDCIERRTPGGETPMERLPPRDSAFAWNYLWFSRLAQDIEASLKNTFAIAASLEALSLGAAVLVSPPDDFKSLLQLDILRKREAQTSESQDQLLGRIQSDLQHLQSVEKDAKEYVAEVRRLWDTSPGRRRDVIQAIRQGRRIRQDYHKCR